MSSEKPAPAAAASTAPAHGQRGLRWTVVVALAAMSAIGLVLLFLLTQATNNRELYERNYALLFGLNVVVAAALLLVIAWVILPQVGNLPLWCSALGATTLTAWTLQLVHQ